MGVPARFPRKHVWTSKPAGNTAGPVRSRRAGGCEGVGPEAGRRRRLVGLCCGLLAATTTTWPVAVLAGWDGAAVVFTAWVWVAVRGLSADDARRLATREDPSRAATDLLLLSASVASLLGAGVTLAEASTSADGPARRQALLSYLFSVCIVGVTINVVAGLFSSARLAAAPVQERCGSEHAGSQVRPLGP